MDINERKSIIHYGNLLVDRGLTFGSGGNLSMRLPGEKKLLITPSGIACNALKERDLVILNTQGDVVAGEKKPSSEWQMHNAIYAEREDIHALVHTHSPYVSVVSTLGEGLPPISYISASAGVGTIPLAPYERFGTKELAEAAVRAMGDTSKAVILANHGLIAGGSTMSEAFGLAQDIEFCAFMYVTALSTGKEISYIPEEEMLEVAEKFKSYGQ
ncbi:MAG: class II aldolase/adducin family protein [Peptoniphilus sp.]|nr:class II aldolase/adducin family protein [Peptoniphilus sp.]MDY6045016.1 class II aldolase/adducin family protein [Peptoniphilus sp.]